MSVLFKVKKSLHPWLSSISCLLKLDNVIKSVAVSFKEKCTEWVSILRINMQKEEMAYGSICISIRSFGILYCTVQCMVGPLLPTYGTYIITCRAREGFQGPNNVQP